MPDALPVHGLQSLGHPQQHSIPFVVVPDTLLFLSQVAVDAEFHQQVDVLVIAEAGIQLHQVGVLQEEVILDPSHELLQVLHFVLRHLFEGKVAVRNFVFSQVNSADASLSQHRPHFEVLNPSIGQLRRGLLQLQFLLGKGQRLSFFEQTSVFNKLGVFFAGSPE